MRAFFYDEPTRSCQQSLVLAVPNRFDLRTTRDSRQVGDQLAESPVGKDGLQFGKGAEELITACGLRASRHRRSSWSTCKEGICCMPGTVRLPIAESPLVPHRYRTLRLTSEVL